MSLATIVILAVASLAFAEYRYQQHPSIPFTLHQQQQRLPAHPVFQRTPILQQRSIGSSFNSINGIANRNNYYEDPNSGKQRHQQSNPVSSPSTEPLVVKHMYFHVPPPDIEASVTPKPVPKKKTYNIVFIKLPSQPQKSQGFSRVEDRTLIYVLVKKPEDLSKGWTRPSNHEVFYVNYKAANRAATQINQRVSEVSSAQSL